jgi:hypothetical protein
MTFFSWYIFLEIGKTQDSSSENGKLLEMTEYDNCLDLWEVATT